MFRLIIIQNKIIILVTFKEIIILGIFKEIESFLKNELQQIEILNLAKNSDLFRVYISKNNNYLIISFINNKYNYIRIVFNILTGKLLFCCKDSIYNNNSKLLISDSPSYFIRKTGNLSVTLNAESKIDLFIKSINLSPINYSLWNDSSSKKVNKNKINPMRNPHFGVFDLETFVDTTGEPYSRVYALGYCVKNGKGKTFYLTDYFDNNQEGSNKLVLACLDNMLIPEFHKYIFYVHNFGRFDAIFIYKILLEVNLKLAVDEQYILEPLYKEDKMLKLIIKKKFKKKFIKITFVDSFNLLNSSLDELCKDFNVTTTKGVFPYSFVNKNNLNYVGPMPNISFFNISSSLYNKLYVNNWSLKDETIKYLNRDLNSLLEILTEFQEHLWFDHNIELTESLTISNLAIKKYLKFYLKDNKIPLINSNNIFQFIYGSYYGGITEVYKPTGTNLTYLDVNSLYPYASLSAMPGLDCKWIESFNNEGLDINNLFGVFYAEVITSDLYIGLLPIKTKSGLIFPNGKFSGVWTSMELQFAKEKGYKIKVIKGLQFNKLESPFVEYVEELSNNKDKLKGSKRQIVKSLLNNLLGRFGLNFLKPITKTVSKKSMDYILATKEIKTFKPINNNNILVTYNPIVNKEICETHNLDYYKVILSEKDVTSNYNTFNSISIIISSFVTAYARIHMHKIKLSIIEAGGSLYYSDTDSIVTDLTLEELKNILPNNIGNKLGQLKLEHLVLKGYFISNKTYLLIIKGEQLIKKAKGIISKNLSLADFESMYFNKTSIISQKLISENNLNKGFVNLKKVDVILNWNSFTKRNKIYNTKFKLWEDTKPLYINNLNKYIAIYTPKNIILYEKI